MGSISLNFTVLANNKISMQVIHAGTHKKRVVISHANDMTFFTSLIHRLGFSRKQVANPLVLHNEYFRGVSEGGGIVVYVKITPTSTGVLESSIYPGSIPFLYWKGNNVVNDNTRISNFIGYESIGQHVYVKSSLVNDFQTTFRHGTSNHVSTKSENVLQKINVNSSIYSYIHFDNRYESFTHQLSGTPINSFDIYITDEAHNVFKSEEHKNFSIVLEFTINNPIREQTLNSKIIQTNNEQGFITRHSS